MLRLYLLVSLTPSKSQILDGDCAKRFCSKLKSKTEVNLKIYEKDLKVFLLNYTQNKDITELLNRLDDYFMV